VSPYIHVQVQGLSLITAHNTAAFAHRTRKSAEICSDSCGARDSGKRNALYNKNIHLSLCLSENAIELYSYHVERYVITEVCAVHKSKCIIFLTL
jgi:hypothetical protein